MVAPAHNFTRAEQIKEIVRCGREPMYFMKRYVKIQHPTRGTIPFDTYDYQDECVKAFQEHRLNIILKSRQMGLSTICAAYAVWMAIFQKDKNILVIATKLQTAMNFIKKVAVMLQNLPKWLLLPHFEPSKQAINFSNGSCVKAVPTSDDAGRSESLSLLIIDEAAFIRDFDEIWGGLSPTFSTGGRAIILSTPNGVGGQYYGLWTEAEAGANGFNPTRIMWDQHPEHDQEWFDKETRNLPKKKVAQEYLCVGGDTKIITPDGYKLASELTAGDLVLTHKGRFKPVTRVKSRQVGTFEKLYEVSSPGNRCGKFLVTGNHPALSFRFWANNVSSLDYLVENPVEQQWINVDEIASPRKTTDRIVNALFPRFVGVPQTLKTIDVAGLYPSIEVTATTCRYRKQWGSTQRFIDVGFDLGKLVGLYLAEGCNRGGGFDMGFHQNELETHVKWVNLFVTALGARVIVRSPTSDNGCRMWTQNKHVGALLRFFVLGARAREKVLHMDRVLAAGPEFIKGLLYGHHLGDGNHTHDRKTCAYSTSSKLVYQLRTLNSTFGLYPRIGHVKYNEKNPLHSDMWYLEFQAKGVSYRDLLDLGQQIKKSSRTRFVNGYFVGHHRLTDVSQLAREGLGVIVYDISVQDDRSFVAQSAILHNCDFIASGDTFLQPTELERLRVNIMQPIEKAGDKREVWIWSYSIPGRQYVISADVARGDARDFSAFHVIDVEDCEVAAEFMGKLPPEKLADLLGEWGKKYNDALIVPENNTFGYFVNTKLRDAGYKRLYYHGNHGNPFDYVPTDPAELPGFPTNQKTRVQILTKLEELIRNGQLKTYSQRLYDQLQAFIWNGNKPMASKDAYDDLIMSLAIGCWLLEGGTTLNQQQVDMAYAMLKATCILRRNIDEMPGNIQSAQPLVNPAIRGFNPQSVRKPQHASQVRAYDHSDFSWLYR